MAYTSRVLAKNCQWFIFIIFCSWEHLKAAGVTKAFVILSKCQFAKWGTISGEAFTQILIQFL